MKINRVATGANKYLKVLSSIEEELKSVYLIGNLPEDRLPTVAIVGSRKPTSYGLEMAYRLSYDAAQRGAVVVSGLAYGIDAAAHKAALDAGGRTIAVLAHGLDKVYPGGNQQLAERIAASSGALLSEYPQGTEALKHHFLARNRIVSGLADVLVVIEAATRSGTLSTAAHALAQGKTVCAVPGHVTSPTSAGCNALIRQGAVLVRGSQDIYEELGLQQGPAQAGLPFADTPEEDAILRALKKGYRDGDVLLGESGLDAALFSQTLSLLEIKGVIKSLGANTWSIK